MKLEKAKVFGKYVFNYLPDDIYVGQRIALEKDEPYLTNLMLSKIKVGDVVLNIGHEELKMSEMIIKKMMAFLKNIYKKIFWVDEYIQIHFPVSQNFLDKKYSDKNE